MKLRMGAVALTVALMFLGAGTAGAATTTLGPLDLAAYDTIFGPGTGVITNLDVPGAATMVPADGTITTVRFNAGPSPSGSIRMLVLRAVAGGTFDVVAASPFRVQAPGISVFPTSLPVREGDRIGVEGDNGSVAARFDAAGVLGMSDGPAGSQVTLDSSPGGFVLFNADLVTRDLTPFVDRVTPNSGSTKGGETITVRGENFSDGSGVLFGKTPASSVEVVNYTTLRVVTPAHAAGGYDITVINHYGTSPQVDAAAYTFVSG